MGYGLLSSSFLALSMAPESRVFSTILNLSHPSYVPRRSLHGPVADSSSSVSLRLKWRRVFLYSVHCLVASPTPFRAWTARANRSLSGSPPTATSQTGPP